MKNLTASLNIQSWKNSLNAKGRSSLSSKKDSLLINSSSKKFEQLKSKAARAHAKIPRQRRRAIRREYARISRVETRVTPGRAAMKIRVLFGLALWLPGIGRLGCRVCSRFPAVEPETNAYDFLGSLNFRPYWSCRVLGAS